MQYTATIETVSGYTGKDHLLAEIASLARFGLRPSYASRSSARRAAMRAIVRAVASRPLYAGCAAGLRPGADGPQRSITGGRAGFVRAVDEAFKARLHNPTIRYSHARGFHVESAHVPADPDVLWSAVAFYVLPTMRRSVRSYPSVRAEILGSSQ